MAMRNRPVLVAPDKFKGSLTAAEVAAAVADGLARVGIESDVCRIADGGEGTLEIVVDAVGGDVVECMASDALGREVAARFALLNEKTALVQSADAIGLQLIPEAERDAMAASSRGVGELILAAGEAGVREVLVAVGGTASTDGGAGALEVLHGVELPKLTVLCDVRAAWEQAPVVFAPQKGAGESEVAALSARLDELAGELPQDPRGKLMTGAGGGLAGGLWSACGAQLKGGAAFVLDQVDFPARMRASRAVITGEGSLDRQTLLGKAVGEVATRARQGGVPCHAIVGRMEMTEFDARILDFESVTEAGSAQAVSDAAERLIAVLPQH
ncbi:MAG: glycerate kinase [Thermoleophilaceae bacterium]|nr:glycerate kinase [Thermoleophilaceae bacterium]